MTPDSPLQTFFDQYTGIINQSLAASLAELPSAGDLPEAMRYSLLSGGKRIRPLLLMATIEATGGNAELGLAAAAATEMVHCYSLIHDDLPAMDDDRLRRGKPTCHIVFGEAVAILAGDGLQSQAFELLAEAPAYTAAQRLQLIQLLAKASGPSGMVAGQAIDLGVVGTMPDLWRLQQMHRLKTGALLEACILMGATCNAVEDASVLDALRRFAQAAGLAFQIRDDIVDVESDTSILGKTKGKDAANNKPTYTSLLGVEGAKAKANELHDNCLTALDSAGLKDSVLSRFANYIVTRKN